MPMKGSPWFPFYPRDFLGDPNVLALGNAEIGIYILLLAAMWQEGGTLPNDPQYLRKLVRTEGRWWKRRWDSVSKLFVFSDDGRTFSHKRLDEERKTQDSRYLARSAAGTIAAEKRWQTHRDRNANAMRGDASAQPQPQPQAVPEEGRNPPYPPPATSRM